MPNPPKPPAIRLLEGNPGKRGMAAVIREQAKAQIARGHATVGAAPETLSDHGREVWDRVAASAFWLDEHNRECLEAYCLAAELLRDDPNRLRVAAATVRSLAAELGLSAVSRGRVGMSKAPKSASEVPQELRGGPASAAGA